MNGDGFNRAYTSDRATVNTGNGTSYQARVDSNGNLAYKDCHTETPGSVIGESLNKHLGSSVDKVVGIKTISDSIDAIMGALINQMLNQGLAALSKRTSGSVGGRSYLQDLYLESTQSITTNNPSNTVSTLYNDYISIYNAAIASVNQSKSAYQSAQACFQAKLNSIQQLRPQNQFLSNPTTYEEGQLAANVSAIQSVINTTIDPLIAKLTASRQSAQAQLSTYQNSNTYSNSNTNQSANQAYINQQFNNVNSAVGSASTATNIGVNGLSAAQEEAKNVQVQVDGFNKDAANYQNVCTNFQITGHQIQNSQFQSPLP
jgi:hypothetical protein